MSTGTKRTLAELITLYELEPQLSEVITEGKTDAAIILWFLRHSGSDAMIYSISDRLDVPASEVRRRGLNVGNKGRVISSALIIDSQSSITAQRVTFVYDVDDDVMTGRSVSSVPCLLSTDYSSIEMYGFRESVVDKLLKITLRASDDIKGGATLESIKEALVNICFARLVLTQLAKPIAMVKSIEKRCQLTGELITADVRKLIQDSVDVAGGAQNLSVDVDALVLNQEEKRFNWASDVRLAIRGHDFTRLCCYFLKLRYPSLFRDDRASYKTPEVFEGALLTCFEFEELASEGLFRALLERRGPTAG